MSELNELEQARLARERKRREQREQNTTPAYVRWLENELDRLTAELKRMKGEKNE